MAYMRFSVGRGRAVVKGKLLLSFVHFHAVFENVIFVPVFHHFLFAFDKIQRGIYFFVHRHEPVLLIFPYIPVS